MNHDQLYYQHTINYHNQKKLIHHFNLLVDKYSKLLPLRLDFHYQPEAIKTDAMAYHDMFTLYKEVTHLLKGVVN